MLRPPIRFTSLRKSVVFPFSFFFHISLPPRCFSRFRCVLIFIDIHCTISLALFFQAFAGCFHLFPEVRRWNVEGALFFWSENCDVLARERRSRRCRMNDFIVSSRLRFHFISFPTFSSSFLSRRSFPSQSWFYVCFCLPSSIVEWNVNETRQKKWDWWDFKPFSLSFFFLPSHSRSNVESDQLWWNLSWELKSLLDKLNWS